MPNNRTGKIALKAYNRAKKIPLPLQKPRRVAHIGQAEIRLGQISQQGNLTHM